MNLRNSTKNFKQTEIGKIPEDWKTSTLGEHTKVIKGISYRSKDYCSENEGFIFINLKCVARNGGFRYEGIKYYKGKVSEEQFVYPGDILIANTDLTQNREVIGSPIKVPDLKNSRRMCISLDLSKLDITSKKLDGNFLYYFLISPKARHFMISNGNGTTVVHLSTKNVPNMIIPLPSIGEQRRIASILSSLDDKIELNQRMNKTLEAIAQAIFKHWFVDFEFPNEEGKPYKSSGGEMVYNGELGKEIPKGWEIHSLSDIAQVVDCLHSKKPSQQKTGHILLQVYNIGENGELDLSQPYYIDDKDYALWTSRIKIRGGDIIISKTGRVGALAQIPKGFEGAIGRNLVCIRCLNNRIGNGYLKEYMLSSLMKKEISIRTLTGTVLQSLHVKEIEKLRVLIPSQEIASKFEKIASPIHDKINKNIAESLELSQIRDTLLPKLMSGEIRVKVDGHDVKENV